MEKPNNIPVAVLIYGVKDLKPMQDWGIYLAPENKKDKTALSTSQLRKFFGLMKRIQADFENQKSEIILLNPKLAYAVGRDWDSKNQENKTKIKPFYDLLNPLISDIKEDKKKFKNFIDVLEAIVAYHKEAKGE